MSPSRALLVIGVSLLAGCASGRGPEIVWREEVKLSSGEVITVTRGEVRRFVAEPFQRGGWLYQASWIEGSIPGVGPFRWDTPLTPLLIDRAADGHWYMVGRAGNTAEGEYGLYSPRPETRPLYIPFRLDGGKWTRIVERDFPTELDKPNLLVFGSIIFEPTEASYTDTEIRKQRRFGFRNGDTLALSLKVLVNRPFHPDANRFYALQRWHIDFGERFKTRCVVAIGCTEGCEGSGWSCGRAYGLLDSAPAPGSSDPPASQKYGFRPVCYSDDSCAGVPDCHNRGGRCEPVGQIELDPALGRAPVQLTREAGVAR